MPTYDYECDACSHTWELFQAITADPVTKCPECGKKKARRLFGTGAALMFKGSGFYETDYRSESYKKSAKADQSSSESNSSSGSDKKTDASSQSKSESKPDSSSPTSKDSAVSKADSPPKKKK